MEMKKELYLLKDKDSDILQLLKLSNDQVKFFEWLLNEDIINSYCFSLDKLSNIDTIEI